MCLIEREASYFTGDKYQSEPNDNNWQRLSLTGCSALRMQPLVFTPSLFSVRYLPALDLAHERYSDKALRGETPALMEKLLEQGVLHERNTSRDLRLFRLKKKRPDDAFSHTLQLMRQYSKLRTQNRLLQTPYRLLLHTVNYKLQTTCTS